MSESIITPPSVMSCSVRPLDKVCREEAETLMDRVLVTPMKKPGRRVSRSKPNPPLHSLRHHSQRSSSSHAFAPYPKRNLALTAVENYPKTPRNKLRRTLSDRSYFINSTTSETSTPVTRRRPRVDSHSPSKQTRRRLKPFKASMATASSGLSFSGDLTPDLDPNIMVMESRHPTQDMDIALDFQALHLDDSIASPAVNLDRYSPSRKDHGRTALNLLVTRLQTALAAEIKARNEAEQQLLREMKRRIEMEELVAQLQHERDELPLNQHSFPFSSPLLLSSSPCISSKSVINSALPLPL